jgi:Putative adhesin
MTTIDRPRPDIRPRSRRRDGRRVLTVAVLALVLLWLLSLVAPTTTESSSFTVGAGTSSLYVEVDSGSVRLTPAEGETLRVQRTVRHGWREPDVEERTDGSRAVIEATCPTFLSSRCEIHYEISVPDGHAVEVSTSSGNVDVRGLRPQALQISASSGRITVVDVDGPLDIRSSSGAVTATDLRSSRVTTEVSSGNTELDFSTAPTDVTVSASSGDVTLQLPSTGNPYRVRAESNSGQAQVDVPTDPGSARSVSVQVSSGDVDVVPR